jgi:hypothetical protein
MKIKMFGSYLDIRVTDLLIILCFSIFFVLETFPASFIRPYYLFFEKSWAVSLKSFVGNYCFIMGVSIMIIEGVYRIRQKYFGILTSILLAFAISVCALLTVLNINMFRASKEFLNLSEDIKKPIDLKDCNSVLNDLYNKNIPLSRRSFGSNTCAELKYQEEGVLSNIITSNGVIMRYKPTADNIRRYQLNLQLRNSGKELEKIYTPIKKYTPFNIVGWTLLPIISIFIGIFIPRKFDIGVVSTNSQNVS